MARIFPDADAHAQKEKLGMIDGLVRNISPGGVGLGADGGDADAYREGAGGAETLTAHDQRVKYVPSL